MENVTDLFNNPVFSLKFIICFVEFVDASQTPWPAGP